MALLLAALPFAARAQGGIGTSTPAASAALDMRSTTQGRQVFQANGTVGPYYSGVARVNLPPGLVCVIRQALPA